MDELRRIPMRIEFIDLSVHDSVQYRLRSLDELFNAALTVTIHVTYKPKWTIGDIVEIDLPLTAKPEGITMRKLREQAKGKRDAGDT